MGSGKGNTKRVATSRNALFLNNKSSLRKAFNNEMIQVDPEKFHAFVKTMGAEELSFREYYLPHINKKEFNKNKDVNESYILTQCMHDILDQCMLTSIGSDDNALKGPLTKIDYNDYEINYISNVPSSPNENIEFHLFDIKNNEVIAVWSRRRVKYDAETLMGEQNIFKTLNPLVMTFVLFERVFGNTQ